MKVLLDQFESQILGDFIDGLTKSEQSSREITQFQILPLDNERIESQHQEMIISEGKRGILLKFFDENRSYLRNLDFTEDKLIDLSAGRLKLILAMLLINKFEEQKIPIKNQAFKFKLIALIYTLKKCRKFQLSSIDRKYRNIQKLIFLFKDQTYFPITLHLPFTLTGKELLKADRNKYKYCGIIEGQIYTKEEIINIIFRLSPEIKEKLGDNLRYINSLLSN